MPDAVFLYIMKLAALILRNPEPVAKLTERALWGLFNRSPT